MIYKAQNPESGNMWDVWLYYHADTYYLFSLCASNKGIGDWDNFSLATSTDGVHWREIGPIITKDPGVTWMGTGSTWHNPVTGSHPAFQINYSSWIGERQTIFFAQSDDLLHWSKCGPANEFIQDERWYEPNGRWDCIWSISRSEGGLYGYWTATPETETGGKFGFGESTDGINWQALPPPRVEGVGEGEVGAIERIGDRYYMLFGTNGHMEVLVADAPQGPFTVLTCNRVFLGGHTYFARFFPSPSGLLVCHHSIARDGQVCFAPLKRVTLDPDGALRLRWWNGNDALKRQRLDVEMLGNEKTISWVSNNFDTQSAIVLEGQLRLPRAGEARCGLYIAFTPEQGAAILIDDQGAAEFGLLQADGADFQPDFTTNREVVFGHSAYFRLLLKGTLLEFYLDDILIECYSMPSPATGKIGIITGSDNASCCEITAWC